MAQEPSWLQHAAAYSGRLGAMDSIAESPNLTIQLDA
jgi:hypothetical protein